MLSVILAYSSETIEIRTPNCLVLLSSCNSIGALRLVAQYNATNAFNFNGNNRNINNNNKFNSNGVRPSFDYFDVDTSNWENWQVPLYEVRRLYRQCRKHKRNKASQLYFEFNLTSNLLLICYQLNYCEYIPAPAICFIITVPKLREVIAAYFGDRIIQTFFVDNLMPVLEWKHFLPDSYSCRVGKGALAAVKQFQSYIRNFSDNYTTDIWIASIDMKAFFMSIDTELAVNLLIKFIDEHCSHNIYYWHLRYLARVIYQSLPQEHCIIHSRRCMWEGLPEYKSLLGKNDGIGIPIGNITSQMMANFITTFYLCYLTSLGYYFIHYTDDTYIIVRDKQRWLEDVKLIDIFLQTELHLQLHPDKRYLQHYSKGCAPLGYRIKFDILLPSLRVVHNFRWKVHCFIHKSNIWYNYVFIHKEDVMATINSYCGFTKHCNAYLLRSELMLQLKNSRWSIVFQFEQDNWSKVTIKPAYKKTHLYRVRNIERKKAVRSLAEQLGVLPFGEHRQGSKSPRKHSIKHSRPPIHTNINF